MKRSQATNRKSQAAMEFLLTYGWSGAFYPFGKKPRKKGEFRSAQAHKRSQAAMEFLLTYGWAIVAGVTALAVLWYYDLPPFSTQAFIRPETCIIDIGLSCLDHRVYVVPGQFLLPDSTNLQLRLKNNLGAKILINDIVIPQFGVGVGDIVLPQLPLDSGEGMAADELLEIPGITFTQPSLQKGEEYDIRFQLVVRREDSGLVHYFNGRVQGTAD